MLALAVRGKARGKALKIRSAGGLSAPLRVKRSYWRNGGLDGHATLSIRHNLITPPVDFYNLANSQIELLNCGRHKRHCTGQGDGVSRAGTGTEFFVGGSNVSPMSLLAQIDTVSSVSMEKHAIRAWVIRWEWAGRHAEVEQPVAALLRPQIGDKNLFRIIEALYAAREYAPEDMLNAIRRDGHSPYRAEWGTAEIDPDKDGRWCRAPWQGEVICGHNPFLVARLARVWPVGEGRVDWEDDSRPGR